MKKTLFVCCAFAWALCAQAQWKPAGDKIKTQWAEQVNPESVLPEYPRPHFAVESSLSGVQKEVGDKNELWYKRTFTVPSKWKGKDIVLNFGAVDWKAEVFVNDVLIGSHKGGFTPFSFNITPYLQGSGAQKLVVRVWDPSDTGRYLVHAGNRYLADRLAGTGSRESYHQHQSHSECGCESNECNGRNIGLCFFDCGSEVIG